MYTENHSVLGAGHSDMNLHSPCSQECLVETDVSPDECGFCDFGATWSSAEEYSLMTGYPCARKDFLTRSCEGITPHSGERSYLKNLELCAVQLQDFPLCCGTMF